MPYLSLLGSIFEISTLEFALWQGFVQKIKILKFGAKNVRFWYFLTGSWKLYCHIWNQHPRIWLIAIFHGKTKMPKFGIKNALFGYFWAGISKNYCHIWYRLPIICLIAKFLRKRKMLKFGTKNVLHGYFWARILEKLLSYLKSAPSNLSICKISQKTKNV